MMFALQHVSWIISYACISAFAIPPFIVITFLYRGRPPWKVVAIFCLFVFLSLYLVLRELDRQQRFYHFLISQGYEAEIKPFWYLSEDRWVGLIKTYVASLIISSIGSVMGLLIYYVMRIKRSG